MKEAEPFSFKIISPDGIVLDTQAYFVVAPGEKGSFGVKSRHAPLLTSLNDGIVRVQETTDETNEKLFVTESGIAEIDVDHNFKLLVNKATAFDSKDDAKHYLKELTRNKNS